MNIVTFLSELKQRNISIRLNGDDLKVSGLKKDTSPDIIDELKRNKAELLTFLRRFGQEDITAIPPAPAQEHYPISNAQRQLWLIDQTTDAGSAYNMFFAQEWNNELDIGLLRRSMRLLTDRHETLRTAFTEVDGEVRQRILSTDECGFEVRTRHCSGPREQFLQQCEREEANHVFDLRATPLLRLLVITFAPRAHMLLFTMHHIISDAWSVQVLMQELGQCYSALLQGKDPALAPLPIQYKDFACWQQLPASLEQMARHRNYWLSQLSGSIGVIDLPSDRKRPAVKTYRGSQVRAKIPLDVLQQANDRCAQLGCRLFSLLTAVFKTLVFRYTGETDIPAGLPVSGRIYADLQQQIGYYVNMVVLRTAIRPGAAFEELVQAIDQSMHHAFEHQQYPFDQLMEDMSIRRNASRSPLFDIMVNYDKKSTLLFDQVFPGNPPLAISKFDVEVDFTEYTDGLLVVFTYNTDLYTQDRMERMAQHFECLLQSALEKPRAGVAGLEYLPASERLALETFNFTDAWYPADKTVMQLFEQQVEKHGAALALVSGSVALSYSALNEQANKLAHYLREAHDVQAGQHVAVMLGRSERMIIAIFGIIKSGAAYVPIDPAYPLQRRMYLANDSAARLVIAEGECDETLPCAVINWEDIPFEAHAAANPIVLNGQADPAYVIYTSGSTGNPKGVVVQHHSLVNFCQWSTALVYKPAGRPLCAMLNGTISFDASIEMIFPPLLSGSSLHLVPQLVKDNPEALLQYMQEWGIEVLDLIPSHMHLLMQAALAAGMQLPSVLHVCTGGELLQQDTCDLLFAVMPQATILNGYGPTESCINATCCVLDGGMHARPNCIGTPLPNIKIHVLDARLKETGIGIWGEICIAGAGLATGYWRRDELTEQKFIHHPKLGRIYRTGDSGRWNECGEVEFAGRTDNQVKIRGFRIETGEIEAAIQSFDGVAECAVTVSETGADKKLAAVIVWRHGREAVQELRQHLIDLLPRYMVPDHFLSAPSIPRNGSGKLDRLNLPLVMPAAEHGAYTGARNNTEERLLHIWEELLDCRGIDVEDNFFEMGGHSLKAMRMVSRICREFDIRLSVKDIFTQDTVQKLGRFIDQQQRQAQQLHILPLPAAPRYALSPGQRSLWMAVQSEAAQRAYNMVSMHTWQQPLDTALFAQAWQQLLERHEILRTVFVLHEGAVWQEIRPVPAITDTLEYCDYTLLPALEQQQWINILTGRARDWQYDLQQGPLLHGYLLQLTEASYVIILGVHHIISDAWSLQQMQTELSELYRALQEKRKAGLPPLRLQYKDFAAWQNSVALDEHRNYWMERLGAGVTPLDLPADHPRPAVKTFAGKLHLHQLPPALLQPLHALARQYQCSVYTLLLAGVNMLLYRYTSQNDIAVGVPSAGRESEELERQLGYYVNALVIRNNIDAGETIGSFIPKVRKALLDGHTHQAYPFEQLAEAFGVHTPANRHPLFDVMVNYEHRNGVQDNTLPTDDQQAVARFDLSVHFTQYTNGITAALTYNTALFGAARMKQMALHLEQVFTIMCRDVSLPLSQLDVMTPAERERVIHTFNDTSKHYGEPQTIGSLFEQQALRTPHALAVQFAERKLDYAQVNERANRLAHHLRNACGVQANDHVGIMMDRSAHMVIALLAIIKSGAAYVPIDPAYPEERCRYMATDSGIKALVADEGYGGWHHGVLVPWNENAWAHEPSMNPRHINTPRDHAYVIYTSGSTGKPKGVQIRHSSLFNLCAWLKDVLYGRKPLVTMVTASISFDASVKQLFPPLVSGSALHIISEDERMDPVKYLKAWQHGKTAVADVTPSFLQVLLQAVEADRQLLPASLQYVLAGGEPLPHDTVRRFLELFPRTRLLNVYGPTEACVDATCRVMDGKETHYPGSIGKPLPNVRLYILDECRNATPTGIFGELAIGGAGLATGYYRQPELTAAKFIEHPAFGRLYLTGDTARWNAQGEIEFLGRSDGQIKLNGFRIETGEVEQAMLQHEAVRQAAVVCVEQHGAQQLAAFVVWKHAPQAEALQSHLAQLMPAYMVPANMYSLEKLPLAPGGKTDRKALLQLVPDTAPDTSHYVPAGTAVQSALVEIWESLLQRHPIGIADDFWKAGGHSLKAMRMMVMIFAQFKTAVSIKDILEARTIRRLAAIIERSSAVEPATIAPVHSADNCYPLSHAQKRLWIIDQSEEALAAYNIVHQYRIPASIDPHHFKKAVRLLVNRHEILRTVFAERSGEPVQQVLGIHEFEPAIHHYEGDDDIDYIRQQETGRVFGLSTGPLFTLALFHLPGETCCLLNMHHIISDAWSVNIFKRELEAAYTACVQGAPPPFTPLAHQYKDYSAWLNEQVAAGDQGAAKQYWMKVLAGELPVTDMPADLPRPLKKTYGGGHAAILIPATVVAQVKERSHQYGCSTFAFLYACLNALLHRYTQQQDIITGMAVAGRNRPEWQEQLGFYVNVLPLRVQLEQDASFETLLAHVGELLAQQLEHQAYPFDQIVDDLDLRRDLSRSPLFDILVNHQRYEMPAGDLSFSLETDGASSFSKYDLTFDIAEFDDAVLLSLSYNKDLYLHSTAVRMLSHAETLLSQVLDNPRSAVSAIDYRPFTERRAIAEDFNDTASAAPIDDTFPSLFAHQVFLHANESALVFDDTVLTYGELNRQANRVAHWLRDVHGIAPGQRVAVLLERSERMVIAVLGIMIAGAAYVPIDPAYPAQRKAYLLDDSAPALVFTEIEFENANAHACDEASAPGPLHDGGSDAYMIYTSGSTGQPKGVLVQHQQLANLCVWYRQFLRGLSDAPLRIFLNASISFDVSAGQLFGTLSSGGTLVLCAENVKADALLLIDYIGRRQVQVIDITPSYLHVLLQEMKASGAAASLQYVLAAGEALTGETCALFADVLPQAKLFNLYGPTEACVYATMEAVPLPAPAHYRSIGRPLPNTRIHILDTQLAETGIGVWGELFIAGDGLAAGYWQRDELTRERFIVHQQFGRLYRTGDTGRWTAAGNIEYKGRSDRQVKVRGFRVEPGETEQAINALHGIAESAVVYDEQGRQLVAFVAGEQDAVANIAERLQQQLPAYMIPGRIVAVAQLPRTGSGKTDRIALQELAALSGAAHGYEAPATTAERQLAEIWTAILQVPSVGVNDNFFELGGHSLKAMRMAASIYRQFGVRPGIKQLFQYQTVRRLAEYIGTQQGQLQPSIPMAAAAPQYPVTAGQYSLWLATQRQGGGMAYNMRAGYEWQRPFSKNAFGRAWRQLLQRHEILRTVFVQHEGAVWQRVQEVHAIHGNVHYTDDIDFVPEERLFDLEHGPLVAVAVAHSAATLRVLLQLHHLVADAWSVKVIGRDLLHLYDAALQEREPSLPVLPLQYKDFAAWQQSTSLDKAKQYWHAVLEGELPVMDLPADYARPAARLFEGHVVTRVLDAACLQALNGVCHRHQCTLFTVLAAAVQALLHQYTSQDDLITGIPVAGREAQGLEDAVGYFVNLVPLRTRIGHDESFASLLRNVNAALQDAYAHQLYPLERMAAGKGVSTAAGRNPFFDVVINYDAADRPCKEADGETNALSKFDLSIHFTQYADAIALSFTYAGSLFGQPRMRRMAAHLLHLLRSVAHDPQQPLRSLTGVAADELRMVTRLFNQTQLEYDTSKTIVQLFEEQAARTPDAVAVNRGSHPLTYAALNEKANAVANYLRRHYHIGREDRIGVVMDRSSRLVVTLLAILKAGAAYVPIDPAYPQARCAYMQQDSGMKLLVAEKEYGVWSEVPVLRWEVQPWKESDTTNPAQVNTSADLAYIIYTSGSTGQPKGVQVTHRSLHNLCAWHANAFEVTTASCGTLYAGIGFDASAWELWPYITRGAAVHAVPEAARFSLQLMVNHFRDSGITHCFLPTPVCEEMFRSHIEWPAHIRLLTGGDRLRVQPPAGVRLYNNYGPTESTVVATSMQLVPNGAGVIPIGRPIANTRIYILGQNFHPKPIGVFGEMFIGGDGLAQGYNNNEALTALKFITHPVTGERLFRTGDFARWQEDGTIEFRGRADNQVKVRGHRIEIAEIERAMSSVHGVRNVRVIAHAPGGDVKLYGCYEGSADAALLPAELRQLIPAYMVPAVCVRVDKFPLTPNGKTDDKALLAMALSVPETPAPQAAFTPHESAMAAIWQEVIGVAPVHPHDDFFELGGHSIKAMQLIHRLEQRLHIRIGLRDVFNHSALRDMALLLQHTTGSGLSVRLNHADALLPVLYMIPPIVGSATVYSGLAGRLLHHYRCIGLQHPGFEGEQPFAESIEAAAAQFAAAIREKQDREVYLMGYSLGALMAFETARLLEAGGIRVTLVLVDRDPANRNLPLPEAPPEVIERELQHWKQELGIAISMHQRALVYQNFHNLHAYRQHGRVCAAICAIRGAQGHQQMQGWQAFTGGDFMCHTIDGGHYDLLSAPSLADILSSLKTHTHAHT